ncbi:hypothetical protein [Mycolicibacterium lacusdiani]|uniref:hypothetical protein n=1 Tax=Mycolicibacterium lacusdiani TaxID=2895283 RepID=UPI001F2D906E|nr:hypothetical protein [Mycolicibacterium lacusdiani]
MTDPDDSATRPISVAELLARNGTIGAPPAGGRRRRRRGNSDSVTVAELTGEIPIVSAAPEQLVEERREPAPEPVVEEPAAEAEAEPEAGVEAEAEPQVEPEPEPEVVAESEEFGVLAPAEVDADEAQADEAADEALADEALADEAQAEDDLEAQYASHLQERDADPLPLEFTPLPRRSRTATAYDATSGAEQMSPDPVADDDDDAADDLELDFAGIASSASETMDDTDETKDTKPSYLRSGADTLFGGGQSVADDIARRGRQPGPEEIDLGDEARDDGTVDVTPDEKVEARGSTFLSGLWIVAQCVLAVAFGAGLFVAFDQLWKWNNIVALVLSVLVILGLVVGVRVVRKTEDIGSTLIAVAVGALVTLGPLALLQSH